MPRDGAQGRKKSSNSGSKNHLRVTKDEKGMRGLGAQHTPMQNRHPETEETTIKYGSSKDIPHDADQVTPVEGLRSKRGMSKAQKPLALHGNDASIQNKDRDATSSRTALENSPSDGTRRDHAISQNRCVSPAASWGNGHLDRTPVYVEHKPNPVDSRQGIMHTAIGVHGPQSDTYPTAMMGRDLSQRPSEGSKQVEGASKDLEAFESLPEPLASFVADVADDNGRRCASFLNEMPDAVNKPFVASTLRQAAITGMTTGNKLLVDSCVKALGIISFCLSSSRAQITQLFTTIIIRGDDEATQRLKQIVEEERHLCDVLAAAYRPTEKRTHLTNLGGPSPGKLGEQKRKGKAENESLHNLLRVSPLMEKQHIIEEVFQKKGSRFFRPGIMFKTIEYEVILTGSTEPKASEQFHPKVVPNILYYISVKVGESYCLALQAKTYGGLGLSMPSHVSKSIESHALIYDTEPRLLPGEPDKLKEQAIKVCLASGVRDLDPAMRLDLGRVYTIEYTVRAQKVGKVAEPTHLVAEWKKQMVGDG